MAADDGRPDGGAGVGGAFARFFRRAPKQARSRAVVDAMITALEEQLARADDRGAEGWTLEALVERAGVGIGSFYEYFASKDSILGALVGNVTERNYRELLAVLDASMCASLEDSARPFAAAVARTYLGNPRATRLVVVAIGRLGLGDTIVLARDRFAADVAIRLRSFFPEARAEDLAETMRMINDAAMGMIAGEVVRNARPDVDAWARRFGDLSCSMLRARHGEPRQG